MARSHTPEISPHARGDSGWAGAPGSSSQGGVGLAENQSGPGLTASAPGCHRVRRGHGNPTRPPTPLPDTSSSHFVRLRLPGG